MSSIRLALSVYRDKPMLRRLRRNAMRRDNSFAASAAEYLKLYGSLYDS
jgi:glycogen synthase